MFDQINTRSITFNLIAVNVIMFIATMIVGDRMYELFALYYPASPMFKPMQVVTHMFMHGSLGHIFFNMFGLFMFGAVLERVWGPKRFLFYYFFTGLGAVALHLLVLGIIVYNFTGSFNPSIDVLNNEPGVWSSYYTPTVGASGALFGVLVGFAVLFPNTELYLMFIPVPVKAKYFISLYVIIELYMGLAVNDNIAHFAHLGGALFGFILVKIWNRNRNSLY